MMMMKVSYKPLYILCNSGCDAVHVSFFEGPKF